MRISGSAFACGVNIFWGKIRDNGLYQVFYFDMHINTFRIF